MSLIITPNGHPAPRAARPDGPGSDITAQLTPQGPAIVIIRKGEPPEAHVLPVEAAMNLGANLIAAAGAYHFQQEARRQVEAQAMGMAVKAALADEELRGHRG